MYDVYNPSTLDFLRTEANARYPKDFEGGTVRNAANRDTPYLNSRGLYPVSDQRSRPGKWQKQGPLDREIVEGVSVWTCELMDLTGSERDEKIQTEKSVILNVLEANFERATSEVRGYYRSDAERETWATQEDEAKRWLLSPVIATPWMDGFLAANPNMTKAELANTIMSNAEAFKTAAGNLGGQLSAKRAGILAATTAAEIDAVDVTYILPAIDIEDK